MPTVTVFTADRMQEIEDNGVVAAAVENGRLILTKHDGSTLDAGAIGGGSSQAGLLAARPAAADNDGLFYFATDENGGTLYRSNGTEWFQAAPGVLTPAGTEVAYSELTANSASMAAGATHDTGLSITIPAGLSRPVMIETLITHVTIATSGGQGTLWITDSANATIPSGGGALIIPATAAGQNRTIMNKCRLAAGISGTFKSRLTPAGSALSITVAAGWTAAWMRAVTC